MFVENTFHWVTYSFYGGEAVGYRIQYSAEAEAEKRKRHGSGKIWMTALFLSVFFLGVHFFWPQGREVLRDILLPGDPESFRRGWECFLSQLHGRRSLFFAGKY